MAISLGRIQQAQAKRASLKALEEEARKAAKAEGKRKKKSSFWGSIGGGLLGALAIGVTSLTGGLAAPLIMGAASSLGKKWAGEASKGASPFGKMLKTSGQVDTVTSALTKKYGFGAEEASDINKRLKESRKTDWSATSLAQDVALSYLSAGLSGGLKGGVDILKKGGKGSIAKAFGGAEGAKGGWEGIKQSLGYELSGLMEGGKSGFALEQVSPIDTSEKISQHQTNEYGYEGEYGGGYDPNISFLGTMPDNVELDLWDQYLEAGGDPIYAEQFEQWKEEQVDFAQGGYIPKYYGGGSVEGSPTIAGYFDKQGKTIGGSNTKSLSQMLGRR